MSVYTPINEEQLKKILEKYSVGNLVSYSGIKEGVENTNYFVNTDKGQFVLTIYEELVMDQLPFFLTLMQHLSDKKVPTITPVKRRDGSLLGTIAGKPVALINRLKGNYIAVPTEKHCSLFGKVIGEMHLSGIDYKYKGCRENR